VDLEFSKQNVFKSLYILIELFSSYAGFRNMCATKLHNIK